MSSDGGSKYFNPIPLFILFREAIEASIVVAVLLAFLTRASPRLKKHVWWGVAAGVSLALALAGVFAAIFYVAQNNVFTGTNLNIFKGCVSWVACIFITYLAFAMLRYEGWEAKWERKLVAKGVKEKLEEEERRLAAARANTLEEGDREPRDSEEQPSTSSAEDIKPGPVVSTTLSEQNRELAAALNDTPDPEARGIMSRMRHATSSFFSDYSLFFVVFFTVLREGMEACVFLFGVGNANPLSIPISGLIGVLCGVMVGVVLYYTGSSVKDIKWLLWTFATVLFFIAAGSSELGADSLMIAGMFGPYVLPRTAYQAPGVAAISSALYGGEGQPPVPSAGSSAPASYSDGDEIVLTGPVNLDDGYVYILTPRQPWWQEPLWDISGCCIDGDSTNLQRFFSVVKPLFGYNATPCFIDVIFYMGYWLVVLSIAMWKWYSGTLTDADWKHTRTMRELRRKQMEEEAMMRAKMGDSWCPAEVSNGAAGDTANAQVAILAPEAVTVDTDAATLNPLVAPAARP